MKRMIRHRSRIAVGMTAIFALWQLGALIHFATVTHTLCPHGQVVDASGHDHGHHHGAGDGDHHGGDGDHQHHGHDDCQVVSALTSARTLMSDSPDLEFLQLESGSTEQPAVHEKLQTRLEIYRLSPSNSPPSA